MGLVKEQLPWQPFGHVTQREKPPYLDLLDPELQTDPCLDKEYILDRSIHQNYPYFTPMNSY